MIVPFLKVCSRGFSIGLIRIGWKAYKRPIKKKKKRVVQIDAQETELSQLSVHCKGQTPDPTFPTMQLNNIFH